ncbi:MAG: hypothetical protein NT064_02975, partial [Proteobacteria bacterium]|nr:hypothetical protein [Pseudomonadota bacterium]
MTNSISNVIKGLTLAVTVAVVPASFAADSVLAKRSEAAQQGVTGASATAAGIIGSGVAATGIIGSGVAATGIIGSGVAAAGI